MANEALQYLVTFKSRAEGDGAQKTAEGLAAVRSEQEKLAAAEGGTGSGASMEVERVETMTTALSSQAEAVEVLQQREDDVAKARKLASERRIADMQREMTLEKESAEAARTSQAMRLGAAAAIATTARRSLQVVSEAIAEFKKLAPEAAEQFSTVELAIQTLQDPIGTLIEGITGTQAELVALAESRANAARMEAMYLAAVEAKQEKIRAANQAFVDGPLARRLQTIKDETAEYERQKNEIRAVTAAMEAQAKMGDAIALSNGADPNQVAAGRINRETAARSAESDVPVGDAQKRWEDAIKVAEAATAAYAQAKTLNLDTAGKEAEMNAALHARDEAKKDLDSVIIQAEAAKAEISAGAVEAMLGVKDQALGDLTDAATQTKAALEAEAAEQSAKLADAARSAMGAAGTAAGTGLKADAEEQAKALSASARESLKLLTAALQDGVITPEEIDGVKLAIEQLKGSREKFDTQIQDGMKKMLANVDLLISNQREIDGRIDAQKQRIEGLKTR